MNYSEALICVDNDNEHCVKQENTLCVRLFVRLLEHGIVSYLIIWSEYIYGGEKNLQTNAFK